MVCVYRQVFPYVHKQLNHWKKLAEAIPNTELQTQALASIQQKTFHCEGGGIYSLLAKENWREAVRFIVAYQTISDYLDNLCDRSTSMDPKDFRMLHRSMTDALNPENELTNYYLYREDNNDGGYLHSLVLTCQEVLRASPHYKKAQASATKLGFLYNDLQVHKHVREEERIPRLKKWFEHYQEECSHLEWYEFSACAGSTLGVFCLVSYALSGEMTEELAEQVTGSYFPYMQGLHILLDYYIDQQEDEEEGDLNFCSYYDHEQLMKERFVYFVKQTNLSIKKLPHSAFHEMIHKGLVGLYLADRKVQAISQAKGFVKALLRASGKKATFFYYNTKMYNKLKSLHS
ncbi:tetraprenyl-beta-curcumene synthase family protein [Halobacillus sp. A5]|uniref:tetraprenyl-beta-curcumene synthase family protein n=1 Tax=Halobacillus sp. A5 TaxID=2880263 RepID=UPI0020A68FC5|nr:tetraprenyl-beta-curcumene synthase family protein [Halobacillus sp. A5]MCP3028313.1 tetraprenyl-beta-curcumene synthase family protein [Halobacillus sp. A5]